MDRRRALPPPPGATVHVIEFPPQAFPDSQVFQTIVWPPNRHQGIFGGGKMGGVGVENHEESETSLPNHKNNTGRILIYEEPDRSFVLYFDRISSVCRVVL